MAGEGGLRDMELIGCGIEVQRFGKDTELSYILKHFIPPDIQGPLKALSFYYDTPSKLRFKPHAS